MGGMYQIMFDYLASSWGLVTLALTSLVFGAKAYDVFAKTWPATSGRYVAIGKITWSEFVVPEIVLMKKAIFSNVNEGLISYSYEVNGIQHNGTISPNNLTQEEVDRELYKGAEIPVFFSPRKPQYSTARFPPSPWEAAGAAGLYWMLFPTVVINGLSLFIFYLAHA